MLALARQYFNTSHVTVYLVRYIFLNGSLIFQYISCYGLSRWEPYVSRKMGISIHLMLRFIISNNSHHRGSKSISIHLMLRFILRRLLANRLEKFHFNTSHVTVYQKIRCRPIPEICYFNTSHVTVYHDGRKGKGCIKSQFQYISCYGLSMRM